MFFWKRVRIPGDLLSIANPSDLTPIGADNKVFETPTAFEAGSLVVFRNGQELIAEEMNGYVELSDNRFELKWALREHEEVSCLYQKKTNT